MMQSLNKWKARVVFEKKRNKGKKQTSILRRLRVKDSCLGPRGAKLTRTVGVTRALKSTCHKSNHPTHLTVKSAIRGRNYQMGSQKVWDTAGERWRGSKSWAYLLLEASLKSARYK